MSNYQTVITEDRRLSILIVLKETPAYTTNAFLLRDAVGQIFGHAASVDVVLGDIAWLAEQGLVKSSKVGDVTLATATARGIDVAMGMATVPGVKRPMPV